MSIVSYAQNFEDVMLWRALNDVGRGFYVDIGAQHPVFDSVSKAFYERGWRGIHVEPTATNAELLRTDRPDETVIQAVVADRASVTCFYEVSGTGLSTLSKSIAEEHRLKHGYSVVESLVTAITLDDLLALAPNEDIHWLKIDVEGAERQVLDGWRISTKRPWVIVIESTYPNTQTDTFAEWEDLVLQKGYSLVYRDGLNRFYLSEDHSRLAPRFEFPPNVFDGFDIGRAVAARQREANLNLELERAAHETANLVTQLDAVRAELASVRSQAESDGRALLAARLTTETLRNELLERAQAALQEAVTRDAAHAAQMSVVAEKLEARNETIRAMESEKLRALLDLERLHNEQLEKLITEQRQKDASARREQGLLKAELLEEFHARSAEQRHSFEVELSRTQEVVISLRAQVDALRFLSVALERERDQCLDTLTRVRERLRVVHLSWPWRWAVNARKVFGLPRFEGFGIEEISTMSLTKALASASSVWPIGENMENVSQQVGAPMLERGMFHWVESGGRGAEAEVPIQVSSAEQLLAISDSNGFVQAAYQTLLRRSADMDGLGSIQLRLERGVSRVQILYELSMSAEGRRNNVELPGLSAVLRQAGFNLSVEDVPADEYLPRAALTLAELVNHDGRDFVGCAYKTLLRREADVIGFNQRLGQLLRGTQKIQILQELFRSDEARKAGAGLRGLRVALARYNFCRVPLVGRLVSVVMGWEGDSTSERRLRAIEQRLSLLK